MPGYIFLLLLISTFIIPILLRKYFKGLQVFAGLIWFILTIKYDTDIYNDSFLTIFLPTWIFGSLYGLYVSIEDKKSK